MAYSIVKSYGYKNDFKNPPRNSSRFHFHAVSLISSQDYFNSSFYLVLGNGNIFQSLEKTSVLQEARTFNETPVNAKKCIHILTKILYLLNQVR